MVTINTYTMIFHIHDLIFRIKLNSTKKLNRKKRKSYSIHIKHAITNIHHLCTQLLEFQLEKKYEISITIKKNLHNEDTGGTYDIITKEIYIATRVLNSNIYFEVTVFHEILHYIFYPILDHKKIGYIHYLQDGMVYYLQNIYYPSIKCVSINLLKDRFSKMEFSPGYYFAERLFNEHLRGFNNYLKNATSSSEITQWFEDLLRTMNDDESMFVDRLLMLEADLIIANSDEDQGEPRAYVSIYRKKQMNEPMLIKIKKSLLEIMLKRNYYIINVDLDLILSYDYSNMMKFLAISYATAIKSKPEILNAIEKNFHIHIRYHYQTDLSSMNIPD